MRVNIPKTTVVVFKKRPVLARNEQWAFSGDRLEVVYYFIHLGMTLSMQLSFNRMAIDQSTKAKRILISLLNSLNNLVQLPYDVFFKLFDRKVSPVLLYGCEIRGFTNIEPIEVVQQFLQTVDDFRFGKNQRKCVK